VRGCFKKRVGGLWVVCVCDSKRGAPHLPLTRTTRSPPTPPSPTPRRRHTSQTETRQNTTQTHSSPPLLSLSLSLSLSFYHPPYLTPHKHTRATNTKIASHLTNTCDKHEQIPQRRAGRLGGLKMVDLLWVVRDAAQVNKTINCPHIHAKNDWWGLCDGCERCCPGTLGRIDTHTHVRGTGFGGNERRMAVGARRSTNTHNTGNTPTTQTPPQHPPFPSRLIPS
jgi:hypothetical protein